MATIYTPEQTALILKYLDLVQTSNNGQAPVGNDPFIADALRAAGLVVVYSRDLHGNPVNRGFTQRSWDIHRDEAIAENRARTAARKLIVEGPDYEGAILTRNDRHLFA